MTISRKMKSGWVPVIGRGGISRVHPALARIQRKREKWGRPRGASFRLQVGGIPQGTDEECREKVGCATVGTLTSGPSDGRRPVWKLVLYGTGPLRPLNGKPHSDGRVLRGALLDLVKDHFGEGIAHGLANHGTTRKSPFAVSLSRQNERRGFVTLLSENDSGALQILRELEVLLRDNPLRIGNGGVGTHYVQAEAKLVQWQPRGCYLDVAAEDWAQAQLLVPAARNCQALSGRAGRRAEFVPWRVKSARKRRLPVQVGPMGAYGYGVLV